MRDGPSKRTTRPRRALKPRRGGMFLLALFLVLSGALRLGDGAGRAFAKTGTGESGGPPVGAAGRAAETAAETAVAPEALLEALRQRELRVADKERRAADQERLLAAARIEVEDKLAELEEVERKLAETITQADKAAEKDVARLVTVYESMKPKDAARLFGEMEPDFAAGFLAQMRPEAAAAVLAGLDPAKAYAISAMLAGRNALAPKG
jgi:flagellar motility protein MotE (MotC chaperone)